MVVPVVGAVGNWIAGAIFGDSYTRAVNAARKKTAAKRLRSEVQESTKQRIPARRFYRWFDRDETWAHLVDANEDSYDELCRDLEEALWGGGFSLRRRPPEGERENVTRQLLEAVIDHFMECLDTSTAVAIADYRASLRHDELQRLLIGKGRVFERLATLPPGSRQALLPLVERDDPQVTLLLDFMESWSDAADEAIHALMSGDNAWRDGLPAGGLVALAEFAVAHGRSAEGSVLYELASERAVPRAQYLAVAAQVAREEDTDRARKLIGRARVITPTDLLVRAIGHSMEDDDAGVVDLLNSESVKSDVRLVGLLARSLIANERGDDALVLLRDATAKAASVSPEEVLSSHDIMCARVLLERVIAHRSTSKGTDLAEAVDRSIRARDNRRRWHGESGEAVAIACWALLLSHEPQQALSVGLPHPDGQATPEEAAYEWVRSFVARAHLALGDFARAIAVAEEAQDDGLREQIAALRCAMDGRREEGVDHVRRAWELAADDAAKFDIQMTASALGMTPIPDEDQVAALGPELEALLLARRDHAIGESDSAILRLRPLEGGSQSCAVLLAQIYADLGRSAEAAEELQHAAERFQQPELQLEAARLLVSAGSPDEARQVVLAGLALLSPGTSARREARNLLIAIAQEKHEWHEVEAQARVHLTEAGNDLTYRWVLVGALINQGRVEDAWRVATSDVVLEPCDSQTAATWAQLHATFNPGAATKLRIADLLEQYLEDEQPATRIVAALMRPSADEEVTDAAAQRWNEAVEKFLARYPNTTAFQRVNFGENLEDLTAYLQQTLEPGAKTLQEIVPGVRSGDLPYGFVAAAARRPYTAALLHRAAGCLLVYPAGRGVAGRERAVAKEALGQAVVVDVSTLLLCSFTDDLWTVLRGSFGPMTITDVAFRDAVGARDSISLGDGTSVGWDPSLGRLVMTRIAPDELAELRRRAARVVERGGEVRHVAWASRQAMDVLSDEEWRPEDNPYWWSWLSLIDYAKANDLPLLSDDVGLRQLAAQQGVASFGSAAVLEVLEADGRIRADQRGVMFDRWREEYCVDLPGLDELVALARRSAFTPMAAALNVSRPAIWQDGLSARARFLALCEDVVHTAPQFLGHWVFAGVSGASSNRPPAAVGAIAVDLLVEVTRRTNPSPAVFAELVNVCRSAASANGGGLDIRAALELLISDLLQHHPGIVASYVLALGAELSGEDRDVARAIAFGAR